jgi:hypothetical protein
MDVIAAFTEAGERAFAIGTLVASETSAEPTVRYRGALQGS